MKKIFTLLFLTGLMLVSCNNNSLELLPDEQSTANNQQNCISDNYLSDRNFEILTFTSTEELFDVLVKLDKEKSDVKTILNKPNFVSLWDIYHSISVSENETEIKNLMAKFPDAVTEKYDVEYNMTSFELLVRDEALAKVLNPYGLIQVGKQIIKREGDIIKVITNGDENQISLFAKTSKSDPENNILVTKVERFVPTENAGTNSQPQKVRALYKWEDYHYSGTYDRVHWEKWFDYDPVFCYIDIGAKITHQEKKLLGWLSWYKTDLWLHYTCDYLENQWGEVFVDSPPTIRNCPQVNETTSGYAISLTIVKKYYSRQPIRSAGPSAMDFTWKGNHYYH